MNLKRLSIAGSILLALVTVPALAQKPAGKSKELRNFISPGEVTPTPEMWFYEQHLRQYQDPAVAVREKAEFRAVQRQRRLASQKWFGLSNLRPKASVDPVDSDFAPGWASNNGYYPYRWTAYGRPWVVVRPGSPGARAY